MYIINLLYYSIPVEKIFDFSLMEQITFEIDNSYLIHFPKVVIQKEFSIILNPTI
jgi:hypothetical protein